MESFVEDLIPLVKFAGWEKLTLTSLKTDEFPFLSYNRYRETVDALQKLKVCLELYHIDSQIPINKQTEFIKRLNDPNTSQQSLVILFGTNKNLEDFINKILAVFGMLPFFPVLTTSWFFIRTENWQVNGLAVTNDLLRIYNSFSVVNFLPLLESHFPAKKYYLQKESAENTRIYYNQIRMLNELHPIGDFRKIIKTYLELRRKEKDGRREDPSLMQRYFRLTKRGRGCTFLIRDSDYLVRKDKWNPRTGCYLLTSDIGNFFANSWNDSVCEKPICRPGYHLIYGNVSVNSFAWSCVLCPPNTHKPLSGSGSCQKCTGRFNIDNGKRTMCIDPYKNVNIGLSNSEFVFFMVQSLLGILMTFFSLIVFVVKRKTPIVSVSDYKMTLMHMSMICLLFVTIPFTFIGKPNFHFCISRLISISLLYVTNIGIVFIKSQKLLLAYLSKVHLTAEEVKNSKIVQIFLIIIFVLSVNTLLAITIYQRPITNVETSDSKTMEIINHCNNHFHGNVLIASTMIIQLMCSIQAFRGRNLPSVMNDGIVVMYATFILTVVFGVSFVIVNAQPPQMKELFQCIAVTINNVVIVFLMYTQKALRMLIFPERNTREYFLTVRMSERSQDVNQAMGLRTM